MTTIAAKWFYSGRRAKQRLIVIHCTVSPEMGTGAEDVARYFANLPATNKASAHKVCDNDSVITCVADEDTAFAAAGANSDGLHLEFVGQPTQTRDEWLDAYSTNELAIGQTVVQEWSAKYDIPLRWLTVAEVADGVTKGVTTHADVSAAFPKVSTGHWDPGPNFPRDVFPAATAPSPSPDLKELPVEFIAKPDSTPAQYLVNTASGLVAGFDDTASRDNVQQAGGLQIVSLSAKTWDNLIAACKDVRGR